MAFSKLKSLLFCWIFHVESGDAFSSFSYNTKHPSSLIYNGGMNLNTKMPHHYFPIFKMPLFSFKLPQAGNDGAPKSDFESVPIISSRKTFMKKLGVKAAAQAGAIICVITSAGTRIAMADMYSGSTLPEGAQQFGRAIRMRSEWDDIGRRLSGQKELSNKEWDELQNALRRLYSAAEDMKLVASNGIPDANKRDYATQKIKLIQKAAQAGDIPIGKKDVRGFLVIQDKGAQLMTDFFDLLRDVPDEI